MKSLLISIIAIIAGLSVGLAQASCPDVVRYCSGTNPDVSQCAAARTNCGLDNNARDQAVRRKSGGRIADPRAEETRQFCLQHMKPEECDQLQRNLDEMARQAQTGALGANDFVITDPIDEAEEKARPILAAIPVAARYLAEAVVFEIPMRKGWNRREFCTTNHIVSYKANFKPLPEEADKELYLREIHTFSPNVIHPLGDFKEWTVEGSTVFYVNASDGKRGSTSYSLLAPVMCLKGTSTCREIKELTVYCLDKSGQRYDRKRTISVGENRDLKAIIKQ